MHSLHVYLIILETRIDVKMSIYRNTGTVCSNLLWIFFPKHREQQWQQSRHKQNSYYLNTTIYSL